MMLDLERDASLPLINPDDFKSVQFHALIRNSASDLQTGKKEIAKLLEMGEQSVTLEASNKLCALGHHMLLEIATASAGKIYFATTARVSAIEKQPPDRARIELTLLQYDKSIWAKIRGVLAQRQDEISDFLFRAKGC
jgi:hypothetical protein